MLEGIRQSPNGHVQITDIMKTQDTSNGFSFIPGVAQYSAGVMARPGFRIERVVFDHPLALAEGFVEAAQFIQGAGRPLSTLCACELRSPAPFSERGFQEFNALYVSLLAGWGVLQDHTNPVARSNVCPAVNAPETPCLHAFSFTVPSHEDDMSFIVSGGAEAPEGMSNYRDHIVRRGDVSTEGLHAKAVWVLAEMERRMAHFGRSWCDTTAVQLYTVHDVYPILVQELAARGAMHDGLTWHLNRPPVADLEYEMDCRRISVERVIGL